MTGISITGAPSQKYSGIIDSRGLQLLLGELAKAKAELKEAKEKIVVIEAKVKVIEEKITAIEAAIKVLQESSPIPFQVGIAEVEVGVAEGTFEITLTKAWKTEHKAFFVSLHALTSLEGFFLRQCTPTLLTGAASLSKGSIWFANTKAQKVVVYWLSFGK